MSNERVIRKIEIKTIERKDDVYETTKIKYIIPSDFEEPDRSYAPKLGKPTRAIVIALDGVAHHLKQKFPILDRSILLQSVEWKQVSEDGFVNTYIRFKGETSGIEYTTNWVAKRLMDDKWQAQLNNLAISCLEMVDDDSNKQGELFDPASLKGESEGIEEPKEAGEEYEYQAPFKVEKFVPGEGVTLTVGCEDGSWSPFVITGLTGLEKARSVIRNSDGDVEDGDYRIVDAGRVIVEFWQVRDGGQTVEMMNISEWEESRGLVGV